MSAFAVAFVSASLFAQSNQKLPKAPAQDVIDRWRKAGFEVGWISEPLGQAHFLRRDPKPGDIVGFRFDAKKGGLRNLPDPNTRFGLVMSFGRIPPKFFFSHLRQLEDMQYLELMFCRFDDEAIKPIPNMRSLKTLNILETTIGIEGMRSIAKSQTIRSLTLGAAENLGNASLKPLAEMRGLQRLSLSSNKRLTNEGLSTVAKLKGLKYLNLGGCEGVGDDGVRAIAGLENLEELHFLRTPLTDACAETLASFPKLRSLSLNTSEIGDATLKALEKSESLTRLSISQTEFTAAGGASLARIESLEELFAHGSSLDDSTLKSLSATGNLKRIGMDNCDVSDAGLAHLAKHKKLNRILMGGCKKITEPAVQKLVDALPELDTLYVGRCPNISDEFAASIKPKLRGRKIDRESEDDDESDRPSAAPPRN